MNEGINYFSQARSVPNRRRFNICFPPSECETTNFFLPVPFLYLDDWLIRYLQSSIEGLAVGCKESKHVFKYKNRRTIFVLLKNCARDEGAGGGDEEGVND